eukprot:TRINITY_DN23772_c0_g1_i1.p1 TRINITY_DN23772_c0_g1~~TRINITY_DN23772_c0_g1_i1.p1  ORF type:complete len:406 (+),score=77.52 TRINITY_DN23772_c0_g1_i1:52-1218(+)
MEAKDTSSDSSDDLWIMEGPLDVSEIEVKSRTSSSESWNSCICISDDDVVNEVTEGNSKCNSHEIGELERLLGCTFEDKKLLETAITHASVSPQNCYERLEFLGDSILGFLFGKYVYDTYPTLEPKSLTRIRSRNVDNEKLAKAVIKHGIHKYLRIQIAMKNTEESWDNFIKTVSTDDNRSFRNGHFKPPKFLADTFEAIVGAIFIDTNSIDKTWQIIRPLLEPLAGLEADALDPTSDLTVICQKERKQLEHRECQASSDELVKVEVLIDGSVVSWSEHKTKDLATKAAFAKAVENLKQSDTKSNNVRKTKEGKQNLNNFCSKMEWPKPDYQDSVHGPSTKRMYRCRASVQTHDGSMEFSGDMAKTKKEAQDEAARTLFDLLKQKYHS